MKLSMGLSIRFGEVDGKLGYRILRDADPGGTVKVLTAQAGAESAVVTEK